MIGSQFWNQTVTALGISATFTGSTRQTEPGASNFATYNAMAVADQAGTLRIEFLVGATWYAATTNVAVAANTPVILSVPVLAQAYRPVFVNGGVAQTSFALNDSFTAA
jgi:hypothetical protein